MNKRYFSHVLNLIFLFAFTIEVISGLTIIPDSETSGYCVSLKNPSLHFSDFLWEEINETEEETGDLNQFLHDDYYFLSLNQSFFFDLTKLFSQYHAELLRSQRPIAIYLFDHTWLI